MLLKSMFLRSNIRKVNNCIRDIRSWSSTRSYHSTKPKLQQQHDKTYTVVNGTVQEEAGRRHSHQHQYQYQYQNGEQRVFYNGANRRSYGFGLLGMFTVLANMAYAGMRAQDRKETKFWRIIAFILGFPGTIVTFLFVTEGSGVAYGVHVPVHERVENNMGREPVSVSIPSTSIEALSHKIDVLSQKQTELNDRMAKLESVNKSEDIY